MPENLPASNFAFLAEHDPRLAKLAHEAEQLVGISPTACMMQIRLLAELLARESAAYVGIYGVEEASFFDILRRLERESAFQDDIDDIFHEVRMTANDVVHGEVFLGDAKSVALRYLRLTHKIAVWFHQSFGRDRDFSPARFVNPPDLEAAREEVLDDNQDLRTAVADAHRTVDAANARALQEKSRRAEAEELLTELREERNIFRTLAQDYENRLASLQTEAEQAGPAQRGAHEARMRQATENIELDERDTRAIIDAQLRQSGWQANSETLRWANGTRPQDGVFMAIAEVPTDAGPADYILFYGLTPIAVLEAKRWDQPVQDGIEHARNYSRNYSLTDYPAPSLGQPDAYKIPFAFAANGREYLHQFESHRGIWFQDLRGELSPSRPLAGWYTPRGLKRLLDTDAARSLAMLEAKPFDALNLRYYQRDAVQAVERALAQGRRRVLLAMAPGSGKTRTAAALVYRMLNAGLAGRVLYLVDRPSLGAQAFEAFQQTQVDGAQTFAERYALGNLDTPDGAIDARVQIATVEDMAARLFRSDDALRLPIDTFDCVIVDECHRSANLERDPNAYLSKYRRLLDYFDALTLGLTATPALHTSAIFGEPIYRYRFKKAVSDGYLVDQAPPVFVTTFLSDRGLIFDRASDREQGGAPPSDLNFAQTPDELDFEIDAVNQAVLADAFNRAACEDLAERIDPSKPGKTLIFCVSEDHAQTVAAELRAAYATRGGPAPADLIQVLTRATDDATNWLRRYQNQPTPTIAITVDLLTSGIDIPELANLVFLRRVPSRILYEQMKGRATRLCKRIDKQTFRIYDYVGLYEALEPFTDM